MDVDAILDLELLRKSSEKILQNNRGKDCKTIVRIFPFATGGGALQITYRPSRGSVMIYNGRYVLIYRGSVLIDRGCID